LILYWRFCQMLCGGYWMRSMPNFHLLHEHGNAGNVDEWYVRVQKILCILKQWRNSWQTRIILRHYLLVVHRHQSQVISTLFFDSSHPKKRENIFFVFPPVLLWYGCSMRAYNTLLAWALLVWWRSDGSSSSCYRRAVHNDKAGAYYLYNHHLHEFIIRLLLLLSIPLSSALQ